jgi:hypothetical protein
MFFIYTLRVLIFDFCFIILLDNYRGYIYDYYYL